MYKSQTAEIAKDRLQNYLTFCFQNPLSFKGFWKEFRVSYFVTIPKHLSSVYMSKWIVKFIAGKSG